MRAYDARSGALRWSWDPIPTRESDPARATWAGDSWRRTGAANVWSVMSVDPERGLVFLPTSSPSPDFYGGERLGANVYANSVVALRAATGDVVWYFQVVHHDLWDYDVPAQPVLVNVTREGKVDSRGRRRRPRWGTSSSCIARPARRSFPSRSAPFRRATCPARKRHRRSRFRSGRAPLVPARLTADDAWGLTPAERDACRARIARLRSEGIFTPPSLEGTVIFPGYAGGTNWGSVVARSGARAADRRDESPRVRGHAGPARRGTRRSEPRPRARAASSPRSAARPTACIARPWCRRAVCRAIRRRGAR